MDYSLLTQTATALYQLTSFQFGNFSVADFTANAQDAFLNSTFVFMLQIISLFITIVLAIAALRLSQRQKEFNQKVAAEVAAVGPAGGAGPIQDQWNDIIRHIESTREGEWKFAVIEADTLVDNVLRNYFPGD